MVARIPIENTEIKNLKKIARLPIKCKKRKNLIKTLTPNVIKKISEVIHNLFKGRIKVSPRQLGKLQKHKRVLRKFKNRSLSVKRKRNLLQRGGFIGPLLSVALPILSSLLSR